MAVSLVIVSLFLLPVRCDLVAHPHSIHATPAVSNDAHQEHAPSASHVTPRTEHSRNAPAAGSRLASIGNDTDPHIALAVEELDGVTTVPASEPFMTNAQIVIDREAISSGGIVVTLPSLANILALPDDGKRTPLPAHGKLVGVTSPPESPPPKS